MKAFLVGTATIILSLFVFAFNADYNLNKSKNNELRYVCEEAAVAGSLFVKKDHYSSGQIVFNQEESIKAIEAIITSMLKLDKNMNPATGSYWQERITYNTYFCDDSNTAYPYLFTDPDTGFVHLVKKPTVIVTINAGKARYSLQFLNDGPNNIRSAAHSWEGR